MFACKEKSPRRDLILNLPWVGNLLLTFYSTIFLLLAKLCLLDNFPMLGEISRPGEGPNFYCSLEEEIPLYTGYLIFTSGQIVALGQVLTAGWAKSPQRDLILTAGESFQLPWTGDWRGGSPYCSSAPLGGSITEQPYFRAFLHHTIPSYPLDHTCYTLPYPCIIVQYFQYPNNI